MQNVNINEALLEVVVLTCRMQMYPNVPKMKSVPKCTQMYTNVPKMKSVPECA